MVKILKTFDTWVYVSCNQDDIKLINKHWLNDEVCNVYNDAGRIVDKYPNHPNLKDHLEATRHFFATKEVKITVNLMSDGTLQLAK